MNDDENEDIESGLDVLKDTVGDIVDEDTESPLGQVMVDAAERPTVESRPFREMLMKELEDARKRLIAKPAAPSSPLDRLIERFNVPTGKSGDLFTARQQREQERAKADAERRRELMGILSRQEQLESQNVTERQRIEAARQRALAAVSKPGPSSEFERLLEASGFTDEEKKRLREERVRSLSGTQKVSADGEGKLPTGELGQLVQARRIVSDPEASEADKAAAQQYLDKADKGKLSRANETQKAMFSNIQSSFINIFDTLDKAKKIIGDNPQTTTGAAAYLQYLPATDARTLSNYIQTIKANIGFDELQKMRMASPTGGALGQVAVQELQFLQSKIATLDQFADRDVLLDQLNQIRESYNRWENVIREFNEEASSALGEGDAASSPDQSPAFDADAARAALDRKRKARQSQGE